MKKHVPIRFDYYQYCVETWIEIFRQLDFKNIHTIIDLCMGWSPKIELALLQTKFEGTLYVVDKSKENLLLFSHLIEPFEKKYKIAHKTLDICNANASVLQGDLLIGNHVIDDIFLDRYITKNGLTHLNLYESPGTQKKTWDSIIVDELFIQETHNAFLHFILSSVREKGCVILAQYPGYEEKLYDLSQGYRFTKYLLQRLRKELVEIGFNDLTSTISKKLDFMDSPYFSSREIIYLQR